MSLEHFSVIVIGAGLSGIGAGCRLKTRCPRKSFIILEAREQIGGTWDLFRFPGVRSDSDMFTLGYPFRPWNGDKAITDGSSILEYVRETAAAFGVDKHIRFQHRLISASWSSPDGRWLLEISTPGGTLNYTCDFLYGCTGYYRYDSGYDPDLPEADRFRGPIVHPQRWPQDLDYAGKKVVIVGSGATAVTLVPAMAKTAAHVTMLQRSPTYILSLPSRDPIAASLRRWLPAGAANRLARWKNILISLGIYQFLRRSPVRARRFIRDNAARILPADYAVDTHFNPRYQPWDQRLCLVPDADFFKYIRKGTASVVTDTIDGFTDRGIRLRSGQQLDADIIVKATGLQMLALGGVQLRVDGTPIDPGKTFIYKGTMLSNVPNFAFCIGYTNASWTLRADLASTFVCGLLNHMDRRRYRTCAPLCDTSSMDPLPLLSLTSGYVQRAAAHLPKQAATKPWLIRQNYLLDMFTMKLTPLHDGILKFDAPVASTPATHALRTETITNSPAAD